MPTLRKLLEEGYKIVESAAINQPSFYVTDYDAVLGYDDAFLDKENKLILSAPVKPDVVPESIEIQFWFGDTAVIGSMLFDDEHFQFTYNGGEVESVLDDLVFQYSDFAYDIKKKIPSLEDFDRASLIVTGKNSSGDIFKEICHYFCSSFENKAPEVYSGVESYFNNQLYAYRNELLMYKVHDISDLKSRIKSLFCI